MLALFLTIAIGYLVGEINVKGFSLGAGAVLFVAIAIGWFAPKSAPAPMIGSLGLALFLYAVGIQYGKQFFMGLTSAAGHPRQPDRAHRRAVRRRGEPPVRAVGGHFVRHRARAVRRFRHQHRDAAGGAGGGRQQGPGHRLRGLLSVRRRRADPVPLHHFSRPQAEIRGGFQRRRVPRNRGAQPGLLRQDARRTHDRAAGRRADHGAAPGEPQRAGLARVRDCGRRRAVRGRPEQGRAGAGEPRSSARRRPAASSRTAATSITCACSRRARPWSAARSAISSSRARRRWSCCTCAAAIPICCRVPISSSNSATASA